MSPPVMVMLQYLTESAKANQTGPIVCQWCNNRHNFIKYGKYKRYSPDENELIGIQRYLCKHDKCRRTFSILPHPFLRICRFSLCMFNVLLQLVEGARTKAQMARHFGISWLRASRAMEKARRVMEWIEQDLRLDPIWAPSPCLNPSRCWTDFIRMFAAKFYPRRYGYSPPTQNEYLL